MFEKLAKGIDTFNQKMGESTSLLALPLLFVVIYEVFMRYLFNAPTVWGFEVTAFLYGIHYMFGLAYTEVNKGHVRVDIFTSRLSPKKQAIIGIFTNLVFFFPVIICCAIWSSSYAYTSFANAERNSTSWAPIIWPYKVIMALTIIFLLLQGISNLIREFKVLFGDAGTNSKEG